MLIGAWFLHAADKHLPHVHFDSIDNDQLNTLNKVGLFIMAITLHNFPEGLSVGVSFGADQMKNGFVLAIAVALQNIPEGLAVALPLVGIGVNKWRAVGIATLTGLVEPIGGLLGVTMVTVIEPIMPIAMGFAGGEDIKGEALTGEYYPKQKLLVLIDQASVTQGNAMYTSQLIEYDIKSSLVKAGEKSSGSKRVHAILKPRKEK